jgi:transcriptional regulator with XRE-family HTH domain
MSVNQDAKALNLHVAREVRAEMARQTFSQVRLGELLGVSQRAISNRLNGQVELTLGDVDQIARVLEIPLEKLLPDRLPDRSMGRRRRAS